MVTRRVNSAASYAARINDKSARVEAANWRDLNSLRIIEHACFQQDTWPLWDLIAVLTLPGVLRFKAVVDGCMVGFIAADLLRAEREAWIATLCVQPEFQRRGIGRQLLEECEAKITMPKIKLSVRVSNKAAIQLYSSFGYSQLEIWSKYYQDGEDALVMEKHHILD